MKIEDKKQKKIKTDKNLILEKMIDFEKNKQLNQFSNIYFNKVKKNVKVNEGVPLEQVRKLMAESDVNLMCETMLGNSLSHAGIMTTKVFEYLAVERPVLALISPNSDMVSALSESGLLIGPFQSTSEILNWLSSLDGNSLELVPERSHIQKFSRETSVGLLLNLLEENV
mgnify:CR=1 FL=1